MAKDRYFFDHDYTARSDDKILELRAKYGAEGYGLFWMVIETMAENENGGIKASLMGGLSLGYGVPNTLLSDFISFCVNIELLFEKEGFIYSRRILKHKEFRQSFKEFGAEGANKRWGANRGGISGANAKQRKTKQKKTEENNDTTGIMCFNIEEYLSAHVKDFETICQITQKPEELVKKTIRDFHLWNIENDKYPKKPLQLIAGVQRWLFKENNFSKNGQHSTATIGKTFEPD